MIKDLISILVLFLCLPLLNLMVVAGVILKFIRSFYPRNDSFD